MRRHHGGLFLRIDQKQQKEGRNRDETGVTLQEHGIGNAIFQAQFDWLKQHASASASTAAAKTLSSVSGRQVTPRDL